MSNSSADPLRFIILIIEDDPAFASLLQAILKSNGYEVHLAAKAETAFNFLNILSPHLIISDLYLPDMHGLELLKQIKISHPQVPLIFLSGYSEEVDIVLSLELGAEDYLSKPLRSKELLARIRKVLGQPKPVSGDASETKSNEESDPLLTSGDSLLKIDLLSREVRIHHWPLPLTEKEFEILMFLAASPDQVFSRAQLAEHIWAHGEQIDARTIDAHISHLRKKMRKATPNRYPWIYTQRGKGYAFKPFIHSLQSLQG
ncbi:MAG: response regulator transcription factor [Candidatus Sericytochromatia bacterium]|nr:response regulator transcription factor [Candidatus Sericytochromatia bacterium]